MDKKAIKNGTDLELKLIEKELLQVFINICNNFFHPKQPLKLILPYNYIKLRSQYQV